MLIVVSKINILKALIRNEFEMKKLRVAKKVLIMEIQKNKGDKELYLTQAKYIKKGTYSL